MEQQPEPKKQVHLTDPRALRAYAHPTRMNLVGTLRREGPLTATQAAPIVGESVASCSYHLRMLAKYGLVEEADPDGPGREKPWRATAQYTAWPDYSDDPAVAAASESLTLAVVENYFHRMTRAVESRGRLPQEWQEAERFTDTTLYLTPVELALLTQQMDALIAGFADRTDDPSRRPEGARRVPYLQIAFVDPDRPSEIPDTPATAESPAQSPADEPIREDR